MKTEIVIRDPGLGGNCTMCVSEAPSNDAIKVELEKRYSSDATPPVHEGIFIGCEDIPKLIAILESFLKVRKRDE